MFITVTFAVIVLLLLPTATPERASVAILINIITYHMLPPFPPTLSDFAGIPSKNEEYSWNSRNEFFIVSLMVQCPQCFSTPCTPGKLPSWL